MMYLSICMLWVLIATDKRGTCKIFFLFLHENIHCGYSLEVPQQGASNEYHNICFREALLMSIHNICFRGEINRMKKASYLLLWVLTYIASTSQGNSVEHPPNDTGILHNTG